ncbi:MAG TPA: spore germination protein, partial [Firmicutes bacterium]|nr:spore germination protein [Bacillota bacterium]
MTKRKSSQAQITEDYLLPDLDQNVAFLKSAFNNSSDCVFREFVIGDKIKAFIICIDGLVSKTTLHEDVLKPLMFSYAASELPKREINTYIKEKLITASDLKEVETFLEITTAVLSGDAALLVEKQPKAIIISLRGYEMRSVSEPHIESIVRGPREGFNESLRVNTSLIRRKIKNPDLVFESLTVGKRTRTDLNIVYVKNLVKEDILNEVRKRIQAIDIDEVLDSGYIEQLIEDNPLSPFATIGYTEKPDVAAAKILEGRVVVIVDGSPTVLTIPLLFIEHFQTAEDYYSRPFYMSFVRLLRYLAFIASIISPAYYIVLASYHQELLQTPLLVSIAASAEGTPFPAIKPIIAT